jgi:hypothetical protein
VPPTREVPVRLDRGEAEGTLRLESVDPRAPDPSLGLGRRRYARFAMEEIVGDAHPASKGQDGEE